MRLLRVAESALAVNVTPLGACTPRCQPFWTAEASYTATCPNADELIWGWMATSEHPISGLVVLRYRPTLVFLATHDSASPDGEVLSVIEFINGVFERRTPVSFPDPPADVEGLARVSETAYTLVGADGEAVTFSLTSDEEVAIEIGRDNLFGAPWAGSDSIEGFAIRRLNDLSVSVVWASRGNGATASKVWFGTIIPGTGQILAANGPTPFLYTAPFPTPNQRHVVAMYIAADGVVYASAVVDPGDDGPFASAVYRIGAITGLLGTLFMDGAPTEIYRTVNHKVEAIGGFAGDQHGLGMILGADNENLGGYIYLQRPPIGRSITISRQARSTINLEDAQRKARMLAKKEAIAELTCYFQNTQCASPYCAGDYYDPICRTAWSPNSENEANQAAIIEATNAAMEWCATQFDPEPSPVILDEE